MAFARNHLAISLDRDSLVTKPQVDDQLRDRGAGRQRARLPVDGDFDVAAHVGIIAASGEGSRKIWLHDWVEPTMPNWGRRSQWGQTQRRSVATFTPRSDPKLCWIDHALAMTRCVKRAQTQRLTGGVIWARTSQQGNPWASVTVHKGVRMTFEIIHSFVENGATQTAEPNVRAFEDPAKIRAAIARSPLFAALPVSAIEDLATRVAIRAVDPGFSVVAQDEPGDAMFVIMSGRIKVAMSGDTGREVTLTMLRTGDTFGEMSLFDQGPRSAHCVAVEPTILLSLSRDDLMRHIQAHPRTAINLVSEMVRRLRRADETIAQLALYDVNERLIHRLVGLAREEGASTPDGLIVRRRPTQQELANMIGSCRETISRAFNQLARDGLVIPRGRSLVITPALIERAERKKAA